MFCKLFFALVLLATTSADVSFSADSYISKKIPQVKEQYTNIEFSFKTIDAHGVLVYAFGRGSSDFLMIELVKGKIRYAANYGDAAANHRDPPGGYHEMYIDRDVADNQWHTVLFQKVINEIKITLDDKLPRNKRRVAYMKTPPGGPQYDFTYEEIFIGGITTFPDLSVSVSQEGLAACFNFVNINKKTVLDGIRHNSVLAYCPSINYSPLSFKSAGSHLQMYYNKRNDIKVGLKFRTVVNMQTVFNHTTRTGERIELSVNRYGKISLQIDVEDKPRLIESWKRDYNDGQWHSVEMYLNAEAPYYASLKVDDNLRRTELPQGISFDGVLYFGLGYTGCMRDVTLNDESLDMKKLRQSGLIQFDDCHIRDFCTPNPCLNGGSCNQTDATFFCGCRKTNFLGSACDKPRTNYTCGDIFSRGDRRSDIYFLDMDGIGPLPAVKVFCKMGKTSEDAYIRLNNSLGREGVSATSEASPYKLINVRYLVDDLSISEIILHSRSCKQAMTYSCQRSALFDWKWQNTGHVAEDKRARWFGEDNRVHHYWGGAKGKPNHCACGLTSSCVKSYQKCNCDARGDDRQTDSGDLTIKEHLPVRKVELFDVDRSTGSTAHLKVGPLFCKGSGANDMMMTFRERFSFVELEPLDKDGLVDAGQMGVEFKTSFKTGVLFYSRGPFTRDYIKMELVSPTIMRLSINIGADREYRDIRLEVDVSSLGITLDDNNWHNASVSFNRKDVTFGVHNVSKMMTFWHRDSVSHLNVDGSPVYLGANPAQLQYGFIGCVRNVYVMGKLHNLPDETIYKEGTGVYLGCGSACNLVKNPCNLGYCVDKYTHYSCNCSVSPMSGNHCHTEPHAFGFSKGQIMVYEFEQSNRTLSAVIVTFGFKTKESDNMFFQLAGKGNRHITCVMRKGVIYVYMRLISSSGDSSMDIMSISPTKSNQFNDNNRHVVRIHVTKDLAKLEIADIPAIVPVKLALTSLRNSVQVLKQVSVGSALISEDLPSGLPQSFTGCSSGMKIAYYPDTLGDYSVVDVYEQIKNNSVGVITATAIATTCGNPLEEASQPTTLKPPDSYASFTTKVPFFGQPMLGSNDKLIVAAICTALGLIAGVILLLIIVVYMKGYAAYIKELATGGTAVEIRAHGTAAKVIAKEPNAAEDFL